MTISVGSQTIGGSGGLPTPTGAGQVPVSSGAGGTFSARALTSADVSGVGVTTGTYAARPASPSVGARYLVTSGPRRGSLYECLVAEVWSFRDVAWGIDAPWVVDAESLPAQQSQRIRAWQALRGDTPRIVSGQAVPWIIASSLGGLPAAAFGTTVTGSATTILRADAPSIGLGNDHSILLAVSSVAASGNNGVIALGSSGTTTASVGVYANFVGSGYSGPCLEYDAAGTGFYNGGTALGSGSAIKTIMFTWSSGVGSLFVNGAAAATPSGTPGASRGVLAADSVLTLGVGRTSLAGALDGLIHAALAMPRVVTLAEHQAFHAIAAERFGP